MLGRLIKDESGIAMGLAVIVVLLVGVMGAGLLVFVRNDLEAVVEVNQGQNAFDMADAGAQVAKRHLAKVDAEPDNYDTNGTNGESEWSYAPGECESNAEGEPKIKERGKPLDFDGDDNTDIFVCIRWLEPAGNTIETRKEEYTPILEEDIPEGTNYFRVTARGEEGEAARQVRAIFQSNTGGIQAHYTPGDVALKKNAAIDVSVFSGGNIQFGKESLVGSGSEDPLGDWDNPPYNTTPRKTSSGDPYTKTGLAAEGFVCDGSGGGNCKNSGDSIADGVVAYDSTTGPKFFEKVPPTKQPQDSDKITYPFPREVNVDDLLEEAKSGDPNIYESVSKKYEIPKDSSKRVVFIDANGEDVELKQNSTFKGVLVVRCGQIDFKKNVTFEGIILLLKGEGDSCNDTGKFNVNKEYTMSGYIYAESAEDEAMNLKKESTFNPLPEGYDEYLDLAYPNYVTLWSWRECYSEDCN